MRMVEEHLRGRDITDERVLEAMLQVPREEFVHLDQRLHAHDDRPLRIGYRQTISQPYIVAFMTQALALDPAARVLEVGIGSGMDCCRHCLRGLRIFVAGRRQSLPIRSHPDCRPRCNLAPPH